MTRLLQGTDALNGYGWEKEICGEGVSEHTTDFYNKKWGENLDNRFYLLLVQNSKQAEVLLSIPVGPTPIGTSTCLLLTPTEGKLQSREPFHRNLVMPINHKSRAFYPPINLAPRPVNIILL